MRVLVGTLSLVAFALWVGLASGHLDPVPTRIVVYSPFTINGSLAHGVRVTREAPGYCWEGSVADPRTDAWRCFRGNYILDPCFSGSAANKWVACPVGAPFGPNVLRLNLTKPLPVALANKNTDPTDEDPVAIRLRSGVTCGLAGGATGAIAGMRLNYYCPKGAWPVGDPHRDSPTWTILYAPNLSSSQLTAVDIATAYW